MKSEPRTKLTWEFIGLSILFTFCLGAGLGGLMFDLLTKG